MRISQSYFLDSAAILKSCDCLVSSDSGLAHLAGALGVKTKLLLKKYPDWRWGTDKKSQPFYQNHELFRQEEDGDWEGLIAGLRL